MLSEFESNMQGNMPSGSWMPQLGQHQQVHLRPAFFNPQGDRVMLNLNVTRRADESHDSMQEQLLDLTQVGCQSSITTDSCSGSDDKVRVLLNDGGVVCYFCYQVNKGAVEWVHSMVHVAKKKNWFHFSEISLNILLMFECG